MKRYLIRLWAESGESRTYYYNWEGNLFDLEDEIARCAEQWRETIGKCRVYWQILDPMAGGHTA